jgi:hypothetical protein
MPASPASASLRLEALEDRLTPVQIVFDYSLDTNHFFDTQAKKDLLQKAANTITSRFTDNLLALGTPPSGTSWYGTYTNPATGVTTKTVTNPSIGAGVILVYAGGRDLSAPTLGIGGPGGIGYSYSGSESAILNYLERGQTGARAAQPTDVAPWGGAITFDTVGTNWYFGDSASGLGSNQSDFFSVACHELGHVLGITSGTNSFTRLISNGTFTGSAATSLYGRAVPVQSPFAGHLAEGITYQNQEIMMDPSLTQGTRKVPTGLDFAVFDDIGWTLGTSDDTIATAQPGGIDFIANKQIETGTDVDMFVFDIARGETASISARSSTLDMYVRVFDASGTQVAFNDDSGGTSNSFLTFKAPYSGKFYVGISTYGNRGYNPTVAGSGSGTTTGSYTCGISFDADANDAGDRGGSALSTGLSGSSGTYSVTASLIPFDVDMYKFTVSAGTTVTVETSKPADLGRPADTYLRLFNSSGQQLLAKDDGGLGAYARLQYKFLAAGTYYVGVSRANDPSGAGKNYGFNDPTVGDSGAHQGFDYKMVVTLGGASSGDALTTSAFPHLTARTAAGDWYVGENAGGSIVGMRKFGHWNEALGWRSVTVGDADGDGNDDIIGRTAAGKWYAQLNVGGKFVNTFLGSWREADGWKTVLVRDFDGDGKTDVLARNAKGQWYLGENTGTALSFSPYGSWSATAGWRDVQAIDWDGDGNVDVIGRTSAGQWYLARNTGTTLNTTPIGQWDESKKWRGVQTGDFDGDGRIDVVGRTAAGDWYLSRNVSDTSLASPQLFGHWNEAAGWKSVLVANFAGDDRPDIAGRNAAGKWVVLVNDGTTTTAQSFGSWAKATWKDVMAANFTGSGYADVVGRSGGRWIVGASNGSSFETRTFLSWKPTAGWHDGRSGDFYNGPGADNGDANDGMHDAGAVHTAISRPAPTASVNRGGAAHAGAGSLSLPLLLAPADDSHLAVVLDSARDLQLGPNDYQIGYATPLANGWGAWIATTPSLTRLTQSIQDSQLTLFFDGNGSGEVGSVAPLIGYAAQDSEGGGSASLWAPGGLARHAQAADALHAICDPIGV